MTWFWIVAYLAPGLYVGRRCAGWGAWTDNEKTYLCGEDIGWGLLAGVPCGLLWPLFLIIWSGWRVFKVPRMLFLAFPHPKGRQESDQDRMQLRIDELERELGLGAEENQR